MQEGLNLNLVLNGATLIGVIGLGVKVYLAGRAQKIEQPLEIRAAVCSLPKDQCNERHHEIDKWRDNIYLRLMKCETDQAAYKATQDSVEKRLESMDKKLDRLIAAE
jgi:hypothetical protein